jgi:hypothetical protein
LPLKEKQIQQSMLEAEARKEATIQNAEAAAQAKVIDSKAGSEWRTLLAEAEAGRIRVTAATDAERLQSEGAILKQNLLLINKIVAERLSDKLQIMTVPADGKFFFANDVLHSMSAASQAEQSEAQPQRGCQQGCGVSLGVYSLLEETRPGATHPDHQTSGGVESSTVPVSDECEPQFIIRLSQMSS